MIYLKYVYSDIENIHQANKVRRKRCSAVEDFNRIEEPSIVEIGSIMNSNCSLLWKM
ncbi:hypothetical protein LEP1GSC104_0025 [Leptospira interrogans str. UI 12621]|uniref:Uncharacterized protein n=1 Tax=Leptospira interrogans str. UI 12621 TaxID=1049937 RepID=A0A0F6H3A2_LEPIR|nr:hypothetical protein LEP1GSC104_0025 [Leptospira interrogans str. UI 12621]